MTPVQIAQLVASALSIALVPLTGQHPELGAWAHVVSTIPGLIGKFSEPMKPAQAAEVIRAHLDEILDDVPGIDREIDEKVRDAFLTVGVWLGLRIFRAVRPRRPRPNRTKTELTDEDVSTASLLVERAPAGVAAALRVALAGRAP
jgi:hypothetical protein